MGTATWTDRADGKPAARPGWLRRAGKRARMFERRGVKALIAVAVLLLAARIALPYAIEWALDRQLGRMEGYRGWVEDVDVSLIRGAYRIEGMQIVKTGGDAPVPFLTAPSTDISLEWGALLDGRVVAEIVMDHPTLNFVVEGGGVEAQTGAENDWRETVDGMVPITINRFQIRGGEVHYRDYGNTPEVDLRMDRIALTARGLSTERRRGEALPARLRMDARVQRSGRLGVDARLDPFAEQPTFNLAMRLRDLPATELNDFLRAYLGVDAEEGMLFLYARLAAREGRFRGTVKPMAEGLELFRFGEDGSFLDVLGDFFLDLVAEIFTNQGSDPDRFATEVPIAGRFESPDTNTLAAVVGVLRNAFVRALRHGLSPGASWERVEGDGFGGDAEEPEPETAPDHEPDRASELGNPAG